MEPINPSVNEPPAQQAPTIAAPPTPSVDVPVPDSLHLEEVNDNVAAPVSPPAQELIMDIGTPRPAPPVEMPTSPVQQPALATEQPAAPKLDPNPIALAGATQVAQADKPSKQPKPAKRPRQKGEGVGMAIVATVIIVLGLAALAVYAYLKTK